MNKNDISSSSLAAPWISSSTQEWEPVLTLANKKEYRKCDIIIDIGDEVNNLFYLRKGQIKMTALSKSGIEQTIWHIDAPNVFGEVPFFHRQPCKFLIVAATNCEVYSFNREFVINELANYPQFVSYILRILAQKVRILSSRIEDLIFANPSARIAKLLLLLAYQKGEIKGNSCSVELPLTHQDLANLTGLHRVTVTNSINKLFDNGILVKNKDKILINDLSALRLLTEQGDFLVY